MHCAKSSSNFEVGRNTSFINHKDLPINKKLKHHYGLFKSYDLITNYWPTTTTTTTTTTTFVVYMLTFNH